MSHVDAACWAGMVQQGGGELFFVPDDEDDLQDNVAIGGIGGKGESSQGGT